MTDVPQGTPPSQPKQPSQADITKRNWIIAAIVGGVILLILLFGRSDCRALGNSKFPHVNCPNCGGDGTVWFWE